MKICEDWSVTLIEIRELVPQLPHPSWTVSFCHNLNPLSAIFWQVSRPMTLWKLALVDIFKWTSECNFCKFSFIWRTCLWKLLLNCIPHCKRMDSGPKWKRPRQTEPLQVSLLFTLGLWLWIRTIVISIADKIFFMRSVCFYISFYKLFSFLFYLTNLSLCRLRIFEWYDGWWIGKDFEGNGSVLTEALVYSDWGEQQ
jgi:hypothetical protein